MSGAADKPRTPLVLPEGLRHIAMIMDGNGRWAAARGLPRFRGHQEGAKSVRELTTALAAAGLAELTLYALSVENYSKRPEDEIAFLLGLLESFLDSERATIMDNGIRFKTIGRIDDFPASLVDRIRGLERDSENNEGMILRLALNYGGRTELVDAARSLARSARDGEIDPEALDEAAVRSRLYDPTMTDPDLLVRTAGEMRISNFLLWQVSYAEIYVSEACWPDFRTDAVAKAVASYRTRERRFGGLAQRLDA